MGPHFVNRGLWRRAFAKSRTHSSAGERSLHTGEVQGSIPCASTRNTIKSIIYLTISCRLYPENIGVQPGYRRPLMHNLIAPLSAIEPRERMPLARNTRFLRLVER